MKLRVLALALAILAFFIFVGSPFQQAVEAVAIVDDAVIGILIAALAAIGITYLSSGSFGSVRDFVSSEFESYALSIGSSSSSLLNGVNVGSSSIGTLLLNNRFVLLLQSFSSYIKGKYNLIDNDTVVLTSTSSSIGAVSLYDMPFTLSMKDNSFSLRYEQYVGQAYCFVQEAPYKSFEVCAISEEANTTIKRISIQSNGQTSIDEINLNKHVTGKTIYYSTGGVYYGKDYYNLSGINIYPSGTITNIANSNLNITPGYEYEIRIETGVITQPYDNSEYNSGDGATLEVGAAWGMTFDEITYRVLPGTYEDAEITYDAETIVQDQIEDTPAQSISQDISDYTVSGLATVFPFCIPFDLYNFVACLAADPVAPSFTWRFYVPGICDEELEIDLSEFNAAAQILRTMELLLFCVGLAFVTRKIIRG